MKLHPSVSANTRSVGNDDVEHGRWLAIARVNGEL